MYQVLYRKWRPKTFSDVVGQPQVTKTLLNELTSGRIAHAYLFTGSRGTGKTSCAKILAKAVNCTQPVEGNPCNTCAVCTGIDAGSMLDVVELDAASNNGVDNIRELCEGANFTPASARYRVYIIDEVHMLSPGAFNALLKTLEEPPEHVIFILATTEIHKLPATILSRCQRFDFRRIAAGDIADRLLYICAQEGASLDPDAALLVARLADGGMRDALSILDQALSRSDRVTEETIANVTGIAGRGHLFSLCECMEKRQPAEALAIVSALHDASKDMVRLCEELVSLYRNLLLIRCTDYPKSLVVASSSEYEAMHALAQSAGLDRIISVLDTLQSAQEHMLRGGSRRVQMEVCLLRLCSDELSNPSAAFEQRLDTLELKLQSGTFTSSAQVRAKPARAPSIPPAEAVDEALVDAAAVLDSWADIVQKLSVYSPTLASFLHTSKAYLSGDYVLIDAPDTAFKLLRESAQKDRVRDAIREVTGKTYRLGPYRKPEKEKAPEDDPVSRLIDSAQAAGVDVETK